MDSTDIDNQCFINEEQDAVRFKVGTSLLTQFIKNHNYLDCIIEAIQNDFDARSSEILFSFSDKDLIIHGNGDCVDGAGWNRLSYSLGYNSNNECKIGTIGNKNQGVRSYLLFGDSIIFKSAGKKVLITPNGSSQEPKDDESTKLTKGVTIIIKFREKDSPEGIPAFSIEQEQSLIGSLFNRLPGIFSQLQIKGWESVLQKATFTFTRSNVSIDVSQDKPQITKYDEFLEYHRKITMTVDFLDKTSNGYLQEKSVTTLERVEYVTTVSVEKKFLKSNTPLFFLQDGSGVSIGLSFVLSQGLPTIDSGHLFYPLELIDAKTGNSLSINAPFVLNLSRQALVATDEFNSILVEKAGELVGPLFKKVLLKKYGTISYKLLCNNSDSTLHFQEIAKMSMKKSNAILNNLYDLNVDFSDSLFCKNKAYLPQFGDLYGFISDNTIVVSHFIEDKAVKELLSDCIDLEEFSIHDLVDLWTNDYVSQNTQGWHYNSKEIFIRTFSDISKQLKYANAFVEHIDELSKDEIVRLKISATVPNVLSEDEDENGLNSALKMCRLAIDYKEIDHLDLHNILNPKVSMHSFFTSILAIPEVTLDDYVQKILVPQIPSMTVQSGIDTLNFIMSNIDKLSALSIEALKGVNTFRTSKDKWVTFDKIVNPSPDVTVAFGDALIYLHPSIDNEKFNHAFNFRKEVFDDEIVKGVNELLTSDAKTKDRVLAFEKFLQMRTLSFDLVQKIHDLVLTVDNNGNICSVSRCYQNTPKLKRLLGYNAHFIDFLNKPYFERFGARTMPSFEDMLNYISELKSTSTILPDPVEFYRELSNAKKRETLAKNVETLEILQIKNQFVAPAKVFIYKKYEQRFFGSMNYWDQSLDATIKVALIDLGCKEYPGPKEFLDVLRWISGQVSSGQPLEREWKVTVQWAFAQLPANGLPDTANSQEKILLTTKDKFTSLETAKVEKVYYNDSEELATALIHAYPEVSFFECGQSGHAFFQSLEKVPKISQEVKHFNDIIEKKEEPTNQLLEIFERLRSKEVINGIQSYIEQNQLLKLKRTNCMSNVVSLKFVSNAESIFSLYTVEGFEQPIKITAGARIIIDTLYARSDLSDNELVLEISKTIAEEIADSRDAQSSIMLAVNAFLTGMDVQKFLQSQKYTYQESIQVPPLELAEKDNEKNTNWIGLKGNGAESGEISKNSLQTEETIYKENIIVKETTVSINNNPSIIQHTDEPIIEYQTQLKSEQQLLEEAKQLFANKAAKPIDLSNVYKPDIPITEPLHTQSRYVIVNERKPIVGLNLELAKVGDVTILVTPGMPLPNEKQASDFLALIQTIVESIGGNPATAKLIVTDERTEARELLPTYPDQIGFNVNLSNRSPIFWILIVAREFASLKYKQHYSHVKAMAAYVEKALLNIKTIDPDFFEVNNDASRSSQS